MKVHVKCYSNCINIETYNYIYVQEGWFCFGMAPVVDGPNSLLPDTPRNIRLNGTYNKVPEISMFTTEDGMVYALACKYDLI